MTLRKNLLTETRNVHKSQTMRTFQHFTLGSQNFEETYNLPAEFETESLLLKYDHSNVDDSIRAALHRMEITLPHLQPVHLTRRVR